MKKRFKRYFNEPCLRDGIKIRPFHALLRNTPFCSLGEAGGRATAKHADSRRRSADGFAVKMKRTKAEAGL